MLGSANSIADTNVMLNSAVAESLRLFADRLENAEDLETELHKLIRETVKEHRRILFNGNGYDEAWIKEAVEKRGLMNYRTTPDCVPHLLDEKNTDMLIRHGIFSMVELKSRCEILLENYCKTVTIEANTMIDMAGTGIIPAVSEYTSKLAETINAKRRADESVPCGYELSTLKRLSALNDSIALKLDELESELMRIRDLTDVAEQACEIRDRLIPCMSGLRILCDQAEVKTAKAFWPYPSYADMLFCVR